MVVVRTTASIARQIMIMIFFCARQKHNDRLYNAARNVPPTVTNSVCSCILGGSPPVGRCVGITPLSHSLFHSLTHSLSLYRVHTTFAYYLLAPCITLSLFLSHSLSLCVCARVTRVAGRQKHSSCVARALVLLILNPPEN